MRYSALVLFVASISSAALVQAQHSDGGFSGGAIGAFHGGPATVPPANGVSGPRTRDASVRGSGYRHRHAQGYGYGYGAAWLPYDGYWDDGGDSDLEGSGDVNCAPECYGPEQPPYSANYALAQPPVAAAPKPQIPFHSASPKLQEIALPKQDSAPKPTPPALFVLNDGERIESRRYLLNDRFLQIEAGSKGRTIPLSAVDLEATIAANQQRGINLIIPQGNNSLFLGF